MKKATLGLFAIALVLVCSCKKDSVVSEKNCECSTSTGAKSSVTIGQGECSDLNSSTAAGDSYNYTCVEK